MGIRIGCELVLTWWTSMLNLLINRKDGIGKLIEGTRLQARLS
jgi:hypothetical protein